MEQGYRIIGVEASPYSVKLRAILRYRRIPYIWTQGLPWIMPEFKDLKPSLMPIAVSPDGVVRVDSTPIALDLEEIHSGRSVLPDDPGHAFLACLIEDFADEWLTKALFHYRFSFDADRRYGGFWVMDDGRPELVEEPAFEAAITEFVQRQTGRMGLVGVTPENASLLEATYGRVLAAMEPHLRREQYLFGDRPSLADFALFGQLRTLGTDPTPMARMRAEAPHLEHWVRRLDDASGVEGAWRAPGAGLGAMATDLLQIAGDVYLPFLCANAEAVQAGANVVDVTLAGQRYRQTPFRYQAKCLTLLRDRYAALPDAARELVDPTLAVAGCLDAFRP